MPYGGDVPTTKIGVRGHRHFIRASSLHYPINGFSRRNDALVY